MIRLIDDHGRDKTFAKEVAEDALYRTSIKPNLSWRLPDDSPFDYVNGEIVEKKKSEAPKAAQPKAPKAPPKPAPQPKEDEPEDDDDEE